MRHIYDSIQVARQRLVRWFIKWIFWIPAGSHETFSSKLLELMDDRWQVAIVVPASLHSQHLELFQLAHAYTPFQRKATSKFTKMSQFSIPRGNGEPAQLVSLIGNSFQAELKNMVFKNVDEIREKHENMDKKKLVFTCVAAPPYLTFDEDPKTGAMKLTYGSEVPLIRTLAINLNFS